MPVSPGICGGYGAPSWVVISRPCVWGYGGPAVDALMELGGDYPPMSPISAYSVLFPHATEPNIYFSPKFLILEGRAS